jgi:tetratricopeptide (TPR) repeat protein
MLRLADPLVQTAQPPAGRQTGPVPALAAAGIAHQDAAARWQGTGDRHGEGTKLSYHGMVLTHLREFKRAIPFLHDAVAIFRETGDRPGEGEALRNLGVALQGIGQSAEAITVLRDAAAIFRETGDRYREGHALRSLGVTLREAGRPEEATTPRDARGCPATPRTRTRWRMALAVFSAVLALGVATGAVSSLFDGGYANFICLGLMAAIVGCLTARHWKRSCRFHSANRPPAAR